MSHPVTPCCNELRTCDSPFCNGIWISILKSTMKSIVAPTAPSSKRSSLNLKSDPYLSLYYVSVQNHLAIFCHHFSFLKSVPFLVLLFLLAWPTNSDNVTDQCLEFLLLGNTIGIHSHSDQGRRWLWRDSGRGWKPNRSGQGESLYYQYKSFSLWWLVLYFLKVVQSWFQWWLHFCLK